MIIWACHGGSNQKWRLNSDGTISEAELGQALVFNSASGNPHNAVKATMEALMSLEDAGAVAARRGIAINKVLKG